MSRHGHPKATTTVVVERPQGDDAARFARYPSRRAGALGSFFIQAFVGANGGGKTLAAVECVAIPAWERGRLVVSNMTLYPERIGFSAGLYQPLGSWREIVNMGRCTEPEPCREGECSHSTTRGYGCVLILDEISAALPSRQSAAVPPQLVRVLNQLRKRDVQLAWTAPNWARCDVVVRECTQAVTVCSGFLPDRWKRQQEPGERRWWPRRARDEAGRGEKVERGWAPNRLFTWATYEAMSYDEFTLSKTAQLRPKSRRSYWRTRHAAQFAYGTLESVDLLDHLTDTGACMDCGLPKRRQSCTCGDSGKRQTPVGPAGPEAAGAPAAPRGPLRRNGVPRLPARNGGGS